MARVLVVDDDPDTVRIVTFRLRQHGHRVLGAASAAEALETVRDKGSPEVVVLDVSMPEMDGLALLARLRQVEGNETLPAIFLSARVLPEDIAAGENVGASYLTKPFVASALLAKIDEVTRARADEDSW